MDHLLANAALLASDRYQTASVEWFVDSYHAAVVRQDYTIVGAIGDRVTLLAIGAPATVTTSGLSWGLDNEKIVPGTTRGVSNELDAATATVTVTEGCVLALHRT